MIGAPAGLVLLKIPAMAPAQWHVPRRFGESFPGTSVQAGLDNSEVVFHYSMSIATFLGRTRS